MAETTKNPSQAEQLEEQKLNQVSGGKNGYLERSGEIFDNKGRRVGYNMSYWGDFWKTVEIDHILYRPCSKCRGPMHSGTMGMWYCDPCDRWAIMPDEVFFDGSMGEFMSLANR